MKIKVGLIGRGNWGAKIKDKLNQLATIEFVCGQNINFISKIKKKKIDWVFIATPNKTHYNIVKKCIEYGINVFCEKPLCLSEYHAIKLIRLSKKKGVKLFVSDLYNFFSKKFFELKKKNFVFRSKFVKKSDNEFFYRFMYHDISILYNFLKRYKSTKYSYVEDKKEKKFKIEIHFRNEKMITFLYDLNNIKKIHSINSIQIKSDKDLLKNMIQKILSNDIDINENNNKAIFIIKFINILKKKLKYVN